ncbi:MAG: SAM-dependent methyltransferase [Candidatus Hydrogenedentes bacterium]|nr:SAM-dependent methyltransferase [Candidatus Hydrogenedentota bacterium]
MGTNRDLRAGENAVHYARLYAAVFLVSAMGIAYQIVLMRVFSIAQYHHFAYMIISMAMLGFGASGTLLVLLRARVRTREPRLFSTCVLLLAISLPGCYAASQHVPFETFELVNQRVQLWYLLLLYVLLAGPFFLVSTCITLGFFLAPRSVGQMYGVNMLGSGAGALALVGMLFVWDPALAPYVLTVPTAVAYLLSVPGRPWGALRGAIAVLGACLLAYAGPHTPVRISQYKGLSYTLQFPDAKMVGQEVSPLSRITAVSSSMLRETPGQISNYPMGELGKLSAQIGLFFDAGAVSPVHRFTGDLDLFRFLDYTTGAAAYRLVEHPHVLVVGAGGGTDVLAALMQGASHVTAVEVDPKVVQFVQDDLRAFAGGIYARPDVTVNVADGRGFLQAHETRYDLIEIALLDSFNASAAGVHALSESYLYTVEAVELYLSRLTDHGVLAITRWLKTPPRDTLKMFATVVAACERAGMEAPDRHLVFLRSWNTGTILVAAQPLTPARIAAVRSFCESRWFDLCWLPGVTPEEVNRFTVLEAPMHYEFARAVLSETREQTLAESLFYLYPATDDRPYFFRFFRWTSLPALLRGMGLQWAPFVEWGYIALLATLVQGAAAGTVLILLPLIVLSREPLVPKAKRWVAGYSLALGLAYMFLELAFIQRFMLFLAYPVYAVAVVLTAFLIFSGCGSLLTHGLREQRARAIAWAIGGMLLLAVGYLLLLPPIFQACAGWPDAAKIALSIALLAPLAFLMGMPFPLGLQLISDHDETLLPWAWGINGCASVIGASLATVLAVHFGFRLLVLLALLIYLAAASAMAGLERTLNTPTLGTSIKS